MFKRECFGDAALDDDTIALLVNLTQQIFIVVERELHFKGFWDSIPAKKKLEAELQKIILSPDFKSISDLSKKRKTLITKVMEMAERKNDVILYAS